MLLRNTGAPHSYREDGTPAGVTGSQGERTLLESSRMRGALSYMRIYEEEESRGKNPAAMQIGPLIGPPGDSQPASSLLRTQLPAPHVSPVLTLSKRKDPPGSYGHRPMQKTPWHRGFAKHLKGFRPPAWAPTHWPVFCDQDSRTDSAECGHWLRKS